MRLLTVTGNSSVIG